MCLSFLFLLGTSSGGASNLSSDVPFPALGSGANNILPQTSPPPHCQYHRRRRRIASVAAAALPPSVLLPPVLQVYVSPRAERSTARRKSRHWYMHQHGRLNGLMLHQISLTSSVIPPKLFVVDQLGTDINTKGVGGINIESGVLQPCLLCRLGADRMKDLRESDSKFEFSSTLWSCAESTGHGPY